MKKIIIIGLILALGVISIGCTKNAELSIDNDIAATRPVENGPGD